MLNIKRLEVGGGSDIQNSPRKLRCVGQASHPASTCHGMLSRHRIGVEWTVRYLIWPEREENESTQTVFVLAPNEIPNHFLVLVPHGIPQDQPHIAPRAHIDISLTFGDGLVEGGRTFRPSWPLYHSRLIPCLDYMDDKCPHFPQNMIGLLCLFYSGKE